MEPEAGLIFKFLFAVIALLFVLALIYLTFFILQKVNSKASNIKTPNKKQIVLKEVKIIDAKNKLILTEFDEEQTLTLISSYGNIIIKKCQKK